MKLSPTFKEQFDAIATRFNEAADDAAKLSAYKDGLTLVLQRGAGQYAVRQYDRPEQVRPSD